MVYMKSYGSMQFSANVIRNVDAGSYFIDQMTSAGAEFI